MFRKVPDNFFLGLVYGAVLLCGGAGIVRLVRRGFSDVPRYWMEPKPELLLLLANIFLFRYLLLKVQYERTGRGVLFVTILLVMIYYFGRMKQGVL